MRRAVTVVLGDLGFESLGGASTLEPETLAIPLMQAIRYYLAERDSGRPGWPYPDFRRDGDEGDEVEVEIDLEDSVWNEFSREAGRQGVSTDRLLQHAALYFMADRDSGRLAQRIVDDLETPD